MKPDLSQCSLIELREVVAEANTRIATKAREEKDALLAQFAALAETAGLTLGDVIGEGTGKPAKGKPGRKPGGSSVPPKYRNPTNRLETWSGRGRQPVWVKDHLATGGTLETCLIVDDAP